MQHLIFLSLQYRKYSNCYIIALQYFLKYGSAIIQQLLHLIFLFLQVEHIVVTFQNNSGKSEGQSPSGQEIISRTPGNCRHPSSQVPKKGHGHTATGSSRTLGLGIRRNTGQERPLTVFVTQASHHHSIFPKIRTSYQNFLLLYCAGEYIFFRSKLCITFE